MEKIYMEVIVARPSKYETHVAPRLEEIKDWVRNGATDKEVWERLGISENSFYEYKKRFSEFSESIKENKEIVDAKVESALLKRALGYEYDEITKERKDDGELVVTKTVRKQVVPDTKAQIFWLKNREPSKWREKPMQNAEDNQEKENERYSAESLKEALASRKIAGLNDDEV